MIQDFKTFIHSLNEGLITTTEINFSILAIKRKLSILNIPFDIENFKNVSMSLTLYEFNKVYIELLFGYLCSTIINQLGWFPSYMYIIKTNGMEHNTKYDESYLLASCKDLSEVKIIYEAKFDKVSAIPKRLYHVSPSIYHDKIMKFGLIPKRKQKLALHDNRIYVCKTKSASDEVIIKMKLFNYSIKHINNYNIYEIDTTGLEINLYNDPNFIDKGFYTLSNIPPVNLTLINTITKFTN